MKNEFSKSAQDISSNRFSPRNIIRLQRLRLAGMSWNKRLFILILITSTMSVLAHAAGYRYLLGMAVGLALGLFAFLILLAADSLKIFAVILTYALATAPLGLVYTRATSSNNTGDMVGGAISLFVTFLFALMISVRYSRGKVWLTTGLVAISALFPGLFLLLVFPSLGLNAARISMLAILGFRCGGWSWLSGLFGLMIHRTPQESFLDKDENVEALKAWSQREQVEKDSSLILQGLNKKEYRVFEDVHVEGVNNPLGHLILGPSGGILVASLYSKGPLTEDAKQGISLPKIDLDKTVGSLVKQRKVLAHVLQCAERDLSLLIVVYGFTIPSGRKSVAFFSESNLFQPAGQLGIIDAEHLLSEVSLGLEVWSSVKVKQTISRAKMKLQPGVYPVLVQEKESDIPRLAPLDMDGHLTNVKNAQNIVPSWLVMGIPVNIATSKGVIPAYRVAGEPIMDSHGYRVVPLCAEEEWQSARSQGRRPQSYNFPVASLLLP